MTEYENGERILTLLRQLDVRQQQRIAEQMVQQAGVTMQQTTILAIIAQQPGMIQRDLVNIIGRRAATISSLLKRLDSAGLVRRKIPSDNTRNKELYLTDTGQQVVQQFKCIRENETNALAGKLLETEQTTLIALLEKLQGDS
ncbi:MarR family winged helix-turn-helix transcriptional regulator [Furfurilactobacillus siliginis]|uniref:HTH marR-type domain-containing protein n=1 Tax=Furfurilactobacillus siliginis TaxID=348151 RepID=A0A0R2L6R3_9LACO|nr:MarR family transcriptional regulator [Furfurilactobacillus siliginis]KRN97282.1 hypothetical protein IV55_GL000210 [Furfurilactobacillus siliginis]GEK28593.1 hypothetical protein LSI01_09040 [Furfurilactobacillus siliginis]